MANRNTFIIAEAGVNHNGSLEMALELVAVAVAAKADAVKFQTFKAEHLVAMSAPKAEYQRKTTAMSESQYEMLRALELSYASHRELIHYCDKSHIQFLSTPFDFPSMLFLVDELGLKHLKLSSSEITNGPLILECARKQCDIILSTGMTTLAEVEQALAVLAFGFISQEMPSRDAFWAAYRSPEGQQKLQQKVTLLHCTSEYPAPYADINLRAMDTLHSAFGVAVGYSDHSEGITIPIAAVARGATMLEKHFTLDRNLSGPDHPASLEPGELKQMVDSIRVVEQALGSSIKAPAESEIKNAPIARKSLHAIEHIAKGEKFSSAKIAMMRPGHGLSPMHYWDLLNKSAQKEFMPGELIVE